MSNNIVIALIVLIFILHTGESGLGKSTLINSLFLTDLYSPEYPGPSHRIKKTVQVCIEQYNFCYFKKYCICKWKFPIR